MSVVTVQEMGILFEDVSSAYFGGFAAVKERTLAPTDTSCVASAAAAARPAVARTQLAEDGPPAQCTVECAERELVGRTIMEIKHNFAFVGASLGCAESERITRGFELATALELPVVVVTCQTGGARVQEGALSLMQLAKVSVALEAHRRAGLALISVELDNPAYGGVSWRHRPERTRTPRPDHPRPDHPRLCPAARC